MLMDEKEYNLVRARLLSTFILLVGWMPMFLGVGFLTIILKFDLWTSLMFVPAGVAYGYWVYLGAERFGRYLLKEGAKDVHQ